MNLGSSKKWIDLIRNNPDNLIRHTNINISYVQELGYYTRDFFTPVGLLEDFISGFDKSDYDEFQVAYPTIDKRFAYASSNTLRRVKAKTDLIIVDEAFNYFIHYFSLFKINSDSLIDAALIQFIESNYEAL
jgi:hypothetical protein